MKTWKSAATGLILALTLGTPLFATSAPRAVPDIATPPLLSDPVELSIDGPRPSNEAILRIELDKTVSDVGLPMNPFGPEKFRLYGSSHVVKAAQSRAEQWETTKQQKHTAGALLTALGVGLAALGSVSIIQTARSDEIKGATRDCAYALSGAVTLGGVAAIRKGLELFKK